MAIKLTNIKIYRFRSLPVDSVLDEHPGLASTTGKVPFTLEETANFAAPDPSSGRPGQRDLRLHPQETTANNAAPTANFTESLHREPIAICDRSDTTRQPQDSQVGYTWLRAGSCAESVERPAWNS